MKFKNLRPKDAAEGNFHVKMMRHVRRWTFMRAVGIVISRRNFIEFQKVFSR